MPGVGISLPLAEDPDSPKFAVQKYELEADSDKFELVVVLEDGSPADVQLVLRGKLDREETDVYVLHLVALDGATPPKTGSVTLTIDVTDVNDNSPVFENATYRVSIQENIDASTVILNVKATDPDSGASGEVVYSFSRKTQQRYGGLFDINQSGDISVTGLIDYEVTSGYVLTVSARNRDPSTSPVRAKVIVDVIDQNDNAPTMSVNTLTDDGAAKIPESAPVGTFIAHMTVIDEDAGENGRFNCSIHTPSFEIRQLYETEFKIVTSAPLDREQRAQFVLVIECQDNGLSPRFSVGQLTVTVQDENDNAPVFSRDAYAADVSENGKPEVVVLTVSATDADAGRNSNFRYSIPPNMAPHFAIDSSTGSITTRRPFDRERTDEMRFTVYAIDGGSPQRTGSADVVIRIADVNDEHPRFTRLRYEFEVPENGPEVTAVGHVMAVDSDTDANNKFDYVIDPETNRHELFAIDSASGAISTTGALDRELEPSYTLRVLAVPVRETAHAGTATVTVYVQDINDNAPVVLFPASGNGTVLVSPFTPTDYIIARLLAYDADSGRNGALSYGLNDDDDDGYFTVDNATGYVRIAKELLDIDSRTFVLWCVAEDDGQPRRRSMARLVLVVNSSVPFQLHDTAEYNSHWIATVVSLVVISTSVLLVVFCVAIVLFIRRRRSETKTNRSPAMVMLEPRHLAGKTFAVHVRQVDRCNNDYSQLSEKQNSDNGQCAWNETSKKSFTDAAGTVGYQQHYDPPGIIRAADSRESLRSHDLLCDAQNGHPHPAEHEHDDSHTDGTAGPSRLQVRNNNNNSNNNHHHHHHHCNTSVASVSETIQTQTNKITWRNHKWGQARDVTGAWNRRKLMVVKQFQTNMFYFVRKVAIVSEDLSVEGS